VFILGKFLETYYKDFAQYSASNPSMDEAGKQVQVSVSLYNKRAEEPKSAGPGSKQQGLNQLA